MQEKEDLHRFSVAKRTLCIFSDSEHHDGQLKRTASTVWHHLKWVNNICAAFVFIHMFSVKEKISSHDTRAIVTGYFQLAARLGE